MANHIPNRGLLDSLQGLSTDHYHNDTIDAEKMDTIFKKDKDNNLWVITLYYMFCKFLLNLVQVYKLIIDIRTTFVIYARRAFRLHKTHQ